MDEKKWYVIVVHTPIELEKVLNDIHIEECLFHFITDSGDSSDFCYTVVYYK